MEPNVNINSQESVSVQPNDSKPDNVPEKLPLEMETLPTMDVENQQNSTIQDTVTAPGKADEITVRTETMPELQSHPIASLEKMPQLELNETASGPKTGSNESDALTKEIPEPRPNFILIDLPQLESKINTIKRKESRNPGTPSKFVKVEQIVDLTQENEVLPNIERKKENTPQHTPQHTQHTSNTQLPILSRKEVQSLMDKDRFHRAQEYIEKIYNHYLEVNKIVAQITGQHRSSYKVCVVFNSDWNPNNRRAAIQSWNCSCPDWGNPCKHVGAFLLHWLEHNKQYPRRRDWSEILQSKTKPELIEFVLKIVHTYPEVGTKIYPALAEGKEIEESDEEDDGNGFW